jgi:hypothetical protein
MAPNRCSSPHQTEARDNFAVFNKSHWTKFSSVRSSVLPLYNGSPEEPGVRYSLGPTTWSRHDRIE